MNESPPHVQTKREIEQLLAARGLRPRKRFGQHFLVDGNLMRTLVARAEIVSTDCILEVGAGTGALTELLAQRAGRVVAVEIDRDLLIILRERFAGVNNVTFVEGDVLAAKHSLSAEVIAALARRSEHVGVTKLVANLPYQVATPLVMNLLLDHPVVTQLCFTVQAEVGERITADPGSKAFGPLSILAQLLCRTTTVARLGPQVFWPRPTVDSVMLCLDVGHCPFAGRGELRAFAAFVREVFEYRRKTLRSALRRVIGEDGIDRLENTFDLSRRAEQVGIDEWLALAQSAGVCGVKPNGA
ncbi:MAG: 16S rRNA (adenine(1518)-N(6)/adenine(1519)-N(6))-dimethyltransferase RsmA [Planctomycetota bacterium]